MLRNLFSPLKRAMATRSPPADPVVLILGTTGTGKSDLAVELARRFNGEIINADAMQMYKGLPIITNKITVEEQRGIPHHMLGTIELNQVPWNVLTFRHQADRLIRDIRTRGKLPIVVGGTMYYIDGLLFRNRLLDDFDDAEADEKAPNHDHGQDHPILDGPTEKIYAKLKEVDPVMALKWHHKDRRKLRRSLEIYLTTGRRASDIYAEQARSQGEQKSDTEADAAPSPWQSLLFWVHSQREPLIERLDKRVDKMADRGLIAETQEMFDYKKSRATAGEEVDVTRGIWQSIGFKQVEPYLKAREDTDQTSKQLEKIKAEALEMVKAATRRYAKEQIKWIKFKTLPGLKREELMERLFLLDSTNLSEWRQNVAEKAAGLTGSFIDGAPLPSPADVSDTAREVLTTMIEASEADRGTPCKKQCEVCQSVYFTEEKWKAHFRSRKHRGATARRLRRSLVPVSDARTVSVDEELEARDVGSDEDLGGDLLFAQAEGDG